MCYAHTVRRLTHLLILSHFFFCRIFSLILSVFSLLLLLLVFYSFRHHSAVCFFFFFFVIITIIQQSVEKCIYMALRCYRKFSTVYYRVLIRTQALIKTKKTLSLPKLCIWLSASRYYYCCCCFTSQTINFILSSWMIVNLFFLVDSFRWPFIFLTNSDEIEEEKKKSWPSLQTVNRFLSSFFFLSSAIVENCSPTNARENKICIFIYWREKSDNPFFNWVNGCAT